MNLFDKKPQLPASVFVAPNAAVIGDVKVGDKSSIWYGCVLRGDVNSITIGSKTNIQDNSVIHVSKANLGGKVLPTIIGDRVTIGHSATLHACTVGDEALIGMGATVMDGAVVEKGAIVAAGALVTPGTTVPSGQVWGGNPAKFLRAMAAEETAFLGTSASNYASLAVTHQTETTKPLEQVAREVIEAAEAEERSPDYDSHLGVPVKYANQGATHIST